jgi:hypothetical protein
MVELGSCWLVRLPGRAPLEVTFVPAADRLEVLLAYPGALSASLVAPPAQSCRRCGQFAHPGLSEGYCGGGRTDLAPAYGGFSVLPADHGASCEDFTDAAGRAMVAGR